LWQWERVLDREGDLIQIAAQEVLAISNASTGLHAKEGVYIIATFKERFTTAEELLLCFKDPFYSVAVLFVLQSPGNVAMHNHHSVARALCRHWALFGGNNFKHLDGVRAD
jgi:hypothetical protein